MELRQLKYFVQLSKTLNFSTAAKELFITQSTLSHQILQLENELGQPLFHRNSHEVMLTEAGQTLLPLAMQTILDADNCLQRLDELKNLMSGELNIGVTFSFACIMAETLTAFLRRYPNVKVNVSQSNMADLIRRLENHEFDFGLENMARLFRMANFPVVCSNYLTLEELQNYDLALPLRGTRARNAFERIIAGKGYHYKVKVEMNYVYLLFHLLRESNYITILSESTVMGEQGLRAIPIIGMDTEENRMYGCIHILRNVYQKKSAQEFIRMLGESTSVLRQALL